MAVGVAVVGGAIVITECRDKLQLNLIAVTTAVI